jgi:ABC-type transport system involved in multi-copper enzyme maturation permease subunit
MAVNFFILGITGAYGILGIMNLIRGKRDDTIRTKPWFAAAMLLAFALVLTATILGVQFYNLPRTLKELFAR